LLEYASTYFDLKTLPDSETKRALQRIMNKTTGGSSAFLGKAGRESANASGDERKKKRRKKD